MPQMDRKTSTCVVIQIAVPRMDLGVIPLTLTFDGNIATCQNVLQEVHQICCPVIKLLGTLSYEDGKARTGTKVSSAGPVVSPRQNA